MNTELLNEIEKIWMECWFSEGDVSSFDHALFGERIDKEIMPKVWMKLMLPIPIRKP